MTEGSLFSRVLRSTIRVFLGSSVSKLALVAAEFALAGSLGAARYGLFSIGFGILLLVAALATIGTNFGTVQYLGIYAEQNDEDAIASVIRTSLVFALVSASLT